MIRIVFAGDSTTVAMNEESCGIIVILLRATLNVV